MIMKEPVILSVPKGYEIDKEQSTERQIVLKKIEGDKVRSWEEYCNKMKGKDSCYVDLFGNLRSSRFSSGVTVGEFEDKEDAKAFAAFDKLIKLRKDWVGSWKPDWTNNDKAKFVIVGFVNKIENRIFYCISHPLSFPTDKMCDEFIDTFKDLLEIAKPLL